MKLDFGYGNTIQTVEVPDGNLIAELHSNPISHEQTGVDAVDFALQNPIGAKRLSEYDLSGKKIAIITSDISRPLPSWDIMPSLLDELYRAGAEAQNIVIVLALGSHREHTEEEKKHLVGDRCFNEVTVVDSDVNNCVSLGKTKQGTPIDFDKRVVDADFRIALGNVEFHYFAGYSGGYKALMPGVSTPLAIQANHSMMTHPKAVAGNMDGNPVRDDINEAGSKLGLDFIVNVVLDEHKNIVFGSAGDVFEAHKCAVEYLDKMYRCPIPEKADIVLVSQGGAPKDANLYQTQKALENAKYAVKDGGTIIVIGACNEGLGSAKFEQ
ncbi:MAG: nickel-dependent lactate racemase [Coriobacteriia bacterium]|nr:nickel-dependent lactate racemase [Coriobacteriia bacterium]